MDMDQIVTLAATGAVLWIATVAMAGTLRVATLGNGSDRPTPVLVAHRALRAVETNFRP